MMDTVTLNGKVLDITLESEKTLGDVLAGIQNWLDGSGQYLSGLEINGKGYGSASMDAAFDLSLEGIKALNITTSSWAELMLEAMVGLQNDLAPGSSGEAAIVDSVESWETRPAAVFLKENDPALHELMGRYLSGALSREAAETILKERIREISDTRSEIASCGTLIAQTASRLEDLPLDIQTGKDGRAAETITLFSAMTEKIFRLFFLVQRCGFTTADTMIETENGSVSFKDYIDEFGAAVGELLSAYQSGDSVLVGDLAEYELAPRLLKLSELLGILTDSKTETPAS